MSWHCLPELAEACSAGSCSDGVLSQPSKWSPTLVTCCLPASATESLIGALFGTTCEPSTEHRGTDTSMSSAVDSLARTYPSPGVVPASMANAPGSGAKWRGSLAKFDPNTLTLRTAQCSLFEDLTECSPTLPRSGLMWRGECYPLPTSAPRICGKEFGSSGGMWTTPSASDAQRGGTITENMTGTSLAQQINTPSRWPTPTTQDNDQIAGEYRNPKSGTTLGGAVRMFPTATATAHKGWSKNHNRAMTDDRLDYTIEREANESGSPGRLNPEFVEWLMGWPIGHTGLEPVEMDRWHEWLRNHSPSCAPRF